MARRPLSADRKCGHHTIEIGRLGHHKEHTLDGNVVHIPAARTEEAFVELHGRGRRGSVIELSEMRQKREFDRAYLQLIKKREREGALLPRTGAEMEMARIEPGQLIDSKPNSPLENPGPQPTPTGLQPDSPVLEPDNAPKFEPVEFPEAA